MTQPSAGETRWNKPSESRFCERSAKPIGLSEAPVERQLAWASKGRHWHTRWIGWGSLALHNKSHPPLSRCLAPGAKRRPATFMRVSASTIHERIRSKPSTDAPSIGPRLHFAIAEYILIYRRPSD